MGLEFEFQGMVDENLFELCGSNLVELEMAPVLVFPVKLHLLR